MLTVTPQQMKFLESEADRNGNSFEMLMETAGKKLAEKITEMLSGSPEKNVLFLCGSGNNAGDCFVAARYLENTDINCTAALLCGQPKTDISRLNFDRMKNTRILNGSEAVIEKIRSGGISLVADGVFGTGFHGEIPPDIAEIFSMCSGLNVLAVDVPSGGNCKTGAVSEGILNAAETVTFGFLKFGMTQYPLRTCCGKITVSDIGIPESYAESFDCVIRQTDMAFAKSVIPRKDSASHKGNFGRLLTLCGSETMPGACVMALGGALRSGAGLIQAAVPEKNAPVITASMPEVMLSFLETDDDGFVTDSNYEKITGLSKKASAVLIGCGLGVTESTKKLVKRLVCDIDCPIILDADGINCIADSIDIIKQNRSGIVITPHPAEMARLCSKSTGEIQSDRLEAAAGFAKEYKAVVVLKGAGTVIAKPDMVYVNPSGNPGMAKGGSGDILAGIIASLAAQKIDIFDAAVLGAFVHGLAGDAAAEKLGMQSMTAADIIKNLPEEFKIITE
ncbi:MAG: NAD(P)H-hydrate dehydratase [Porcipelethomonas sp.]